MVPESYFRHQTLCNDRVFRNTSDRVRLNQPDRVIGIGGRVNRNTQTCHSFIFAGLQVI